jgi:hypothetical protein
MSKAPDPTVQKAAASAASNFFKKVLIPGLIGALIGASVAAAGKELQPILGLSLMTTSDWVLFGLSFPILFVLAVVVHELGHLVGALICGFRFRVITIGPWSIVSTADGIRHRFSLAALYMLSGQQISSPPPNGATDRQYQIYLLGGGVANVLISVFTILFIQIFTTVTTTVEPNDLIDATSANVVSTTATTVLLPILFETMLHTFAVLNVTLGILNFVPFKAAGVATDGAHILALIRDGDNAKRFRALFTVIADMYSGVRPRYWSQKTIDDIALGDATEIEKATSFLMQIQAFIDREDVESARAPVESLEAMYSDISLAIRGQFAVDLAFYYGVLMLDAQKARRYADDVSTKTYLISPAAIHRAKASAFFAEGNYEKSASEVKLGLSKINQSTSEFDRVMELEWLKVIQIKIEQNPTALAAQDNLRLTN